VINVPRLRDQWQRLDVTVRDLPLALALAAVALMPDVNSHGTQVGAVPTRPMDALAVGVVALECLPLVRDDRALSRTGVTTIIDARPDLEVLGECADGRAAVDSWAGRLETR
jgi:hypothetical protein